jgi:hypothetical protein
MVPFTSSPEVWIRVLLDGVPILGPLVAVSIAFAVRPTREHLAPFAFTWAVALSSYGAYFFIELNHRTGEGHRFMTALRYVMPILGVLWLAVAPRLVLSQVLAVGTVAASAFCTIGFATYRLEEITASVSLNGMNEYQYAIDCRKAMGSRFGERPLPTYIDQRIWYLYAGCHPVFAPGGVGVDKKVLACGWPQYGGAALNELRTEMVRPGEPLRVACSTRVAGDDVCTRARQIGPCAAAGTDVDVCTIPADRLKELGP